VQEVNQRKVDLESTSRATHGLRATMGTPDPINSMQCARSSSRNNISSSGSTNEKNDTNPMQIKQPALQRDRKT